ncbi:unnamed protein product [Parnassius apollo]|uniref:(apollo) hypothetical protein n=1 Tax=Parnassius apollo TaxID=110799 RepID=A0A8S3XIF6_PARAO|nr:unnamed protein product [Parnassius apollo]
MFKLVALCTFLAVAAAKPGLLIAPAAYSTTIVEPARTTISEQASSVIHPSPAFYSAGYQLTHFINKRSAPVAFNSYLDPAHYIAGTPLATTYSYTAPFVQTSSILSASPVYTNTHFIKKRSAPVVTSYIAPSTYAAPWYTYTAASPVISTPLISSYPISYQPYFIKK